MMSPVESGTCFFLNTGFLMYLFRYKAYYGIQRLCIIYRNCNHGVSLYFFCSGNIDKNIKCIDSQRLVITMYVLEKVVKNTKIFKII